MRIPLALFLIGLLIAASLQPVLSEEDEYDEEDESETPKGKEAGKEPAEEKDDVVVLTDANFDETLKKHKFALIEFYAPWCGHCKNLAPHYSKAATTLKAYDDSILIAKVDATEHKKVAERYGVQGYPTIKWFVDGKDIEYNGGRDEEAIVRWVKKKSGPPAETVTTVDRLKALEKENEAFLLGYFSAFEGEDYAAFLAAASSGDGSVFTQTTSKEVAAAAGIDGKPPAMVMIQNFDGYDREVATYNGKFSASEIETFAKNEKLPLVVPFVEKNQEKIFDSSMDTHILVLHKKAEIDPKSTFMKMVLKVAEEFKGKLMFVSVDADDEAASTPIVSFFGADITKVPILYGFQLQKNKKFLYNDEFTEAALTTFCKDLIAGKIDPVYKSQEPPEVDEEDHVKIVVGKTLDTIVMDPKKDVLLEVYAPWCGHCKQLEPIYKKLGKRFASVDSVVIAKMDGTENEHKDVDVSGFPTLMFFPAGEGAEKIVYDGGDRSLLSLTKFIKKHAKIPYELPKKKKDKDDGDEPDASDKTEL